MSDIYEIKRSTLEGIANAVRTKTGGTEGILSEDLESQILSINTKEDLSEEIGTQDDLIDELRDILNEKSSISLPTLNSPASAEHIQSGYEAINNNGEVVTGTYNFAEATSATATTEDILTGKTAYVNGVKVEGSFVPNNITGITYGQIRIENSWEYTIDFGVPFKYVVFSQMMTGESDKAVVRDSSGNAYGSMDYWLTKFEIVNATTVKVQAMYITGWLDYTVFY